MADGITVSGMDRVLNNLHLITPGYNRRANRKASEKAMRRLRKLVKQATPVQSPEEYAHKAKHGRPKGHRMKDNIRLDSKVYANGSVWVGVGFEYSANAGGGKSAAHAHLPTKGFKAFTHAQYKLMRMRGHLDGAYRRIRFFSHPGYRGDNYMWKTMLQNEGMVLNTFFTAYRANLFRQINKASTGKGK